jgi:hypothetical protein
MSGTQPDNLISCRKVFGIFGYQRANIFGDSCRSGYFGVGLAALSRWARGSRKEPGMLCFENATCAPNGKEILGKAFAGVDIIIEHLYCLINSNIWGIFSKELLRYLLRISATLFLENWLCEDLNLYEQGYQRSLIENGGSPQEMSGISCIYVSFKFTCYVKILLGLLLSFLGLFLLGKTASVSYLHTNKPIRSNY